MIEFISDKRDLFRVFDQNMTLDLLVQYITKHMRFLCVVTVVHAMSVA